MAVTACSGGGGGDSGDGGGGDGVVPCSNAPVGADPAGTGRPHIVVSGAASERGFALSPVMQGANVNKWFHHAEGLWDPTTKAPDPDAVAKIRTAGLGLLRHPGGTAANLFHWKRSVGPIAGRRCQIDATSGQGRPDTDYGSAEFMSLVRATGADAQIMVPFAVESPADVADWVEYMNAPAGTNPNGGTAWADIRAVSSVEPYHVTRWEIGNEQDRGSEGYWMASDMATRLAQYIDGADIQYTDQAAFRDCDFSETNTTSAAGQRFYLRYGLIKPGSAVTVKVGGVAWTGIADLTTAGPSDRVYLLDRDDGSLVFGDGAHGAIPPAGKAVTVTYTFHHAGFAAIYRKMKDTAQQIGIDIQVCATWAPVEARGSSSIGTPSFAVAMAARGLADQYDCVAMHPYTNFGRDFGDVWSGPVDAHHEHMLGALWADKMLDALSDDLASHSKNGAAFVTVSEFGALWFEDSSTSHQSTAAVPNYSATMMHALYMASQWVHMARKQVGWIEGNALVAEADSLRSTFGGASTGFQISAEALTRQALAPVFAKDSSWAPSRVDDQEYVTVGTTGDQWPVLEVAASVGSDGALRIVVVNRRIASSEDAVVVPDGFTEGAQVEVTTVQGASVGSYNGSDSEGQGDNSVVLQPTTIHVEHAAFVYTFPAASITVLTLRPAC